MCFLLSSRFFFVSFSSAREWIGPMTIMYFLNDMLQTLALPSGSSSAFARYEWHLVIVSNPDGFLYSWLTDRLWRKNRSPNPGQSGACAFGTDLNRNFNNHWLESGASTNPCSEVYAGPRAASEVETVTLQNYMVSIASRALCFCDVHW